MSKRIRASTGNVFLDLGFAPGEAENLRVRSDLLIRLGEVIKTRRLTQAAAAKLLGVSQPRVSDLMRGKIDRFSVDSLVEMLGRIGMRVDFTTTRRRARVA
ncbi:MAG: helix-turn-helix transcriptional regulator [Phycisphaerales bacterium]